MNEYLSTKIKVVSLISIIMVVCSHAYNLTTKFAGNTQTLNGMDLNSFVQELSTNGITRVSLPLFFLLSGYLFFLNFKPTVHNFLIKYKKRFFSLVIPFMFWSIWGILLFFIMQSIPISSGFFTNELVKNYSITKILDTVFIHPIPYQLWFITDLIKYVIITPIIYICISKFSYYSLIPFVFFWFFDINLVFVNAEGILFFLVGCLFAIKQISPNNIKVKNKYEAYIIAFIWIGMLFAQTYFIFEGAYFIEYLNKISLIIGILAVWTVYDVCISNQIKKTKAFRLTEFTFFIYASHEPILTIIKKAMLKITGVSLYSNLAVYFISPILTIAFSVMIALFLKRYTKQLYGVITGGRI